MKYSDQIKTMEKCLSHAAFHIPCGLCEQENLAKEEHAMLVKGIERFKQFENLLLLKKENVRLLEILNFIQTETRNASIREL